MPTTKVQKHSKSPPESINSIPWYLVTLYSNFPSASPQMLYLQRQNRDRFDRTPRPIADERSPIAGAIGGEIDGETFWWKNASSTLPSCPPAPHTSPSSANEDVITFPRLLPIRLPTATELAGVTDILSVMYVSAIFLETPVSSPSELSEEHSPEPVPSRASAFLRARLFFRSAFCHRVSSASPLAPALKLRELASISSKSPSSPELSL